MNIYVLITLIVTWVIIAFFFTYGIFFDKQEKPFKDENKYFKIIALFIVYTPFINHLLGIIIGSLALWKYVIHKSYVKFKEKYKIYNERYKIYRERKQKIKLGIIRITADDPYGEENWME